ncbi:hypothetical protein [Trinickia fusca]|uniref:NACHT domain-containing protein n=1 Tax=Trinickia fusca TaxID=2419777 RepID=A0A494XC08_9BURK|nr:hypothetical protein [Trinickia fusca]RKP46056.1 hypothetical protein D7S89_19010 [Trinickia fusca]
MSDANTTNAAQTHRGSAGGSASTGGAEYSSAVAAWAAVKLLAGGGASLDWNLPSHVSIASIHCESATEVDDLVLSLAAPGKVYIQIKHGLGFGSEFKKAVDQLVRQFLRPGFSPQNDRLVILTDDSASGSIRTDLKTVLERCRHLPSISKLSEEAGKSEATREAWHRLSTAIDERWKTVSGSVGPTDAELRTFLSCTYLTVCDPTHGRDAHYAIELLKRIGDEAQAAIIWDRLNRQVMTHAVLRTPVDRPLLWSKLEEVGLSVSVRRIPMLRREASLSELFRAMTQSIVDTETQEDRYDASHYVSRTSLDKAFAAFLAGDRALMIVVGQSGNGKSTWCIAQSAGQRAMPTLLVQGERLAADDATFEDTVWRLLDEHVTDRGGRLLAKPEILEWISHTPLLVIIDGLDRAPEPVIARLQPWLQSTIAFLRKAKVKLVLGSRPETFAGAAHLFKSQQSLVYKTNDESPYTVLEDFDEHEAIQAANLRGKPWLSKYRHPSLMAFSGAVEIQDDGTTLSSSEIIEQYLDYRIGDIQMRSGRLRELLDDFVDNIATVLADSHTGQLPRSVVTALIEKDPAAFNALKRGNFLRYAGDWVRVEPDEVSELLAARKIDIAQTIVELASHFEHPLKLGALRRAIVMLARQSPDKAIEALTNVIGVFEQSLDRSARLFAASVFIEFEDWSGLHPLAERLLAEWNITNLVLGVDRYDTFLPIARSSCWSPMERVKLLWRLAGGEYHFEWRQKDWPRIASVMWISSPEVDWAAAMLEAIETAPSDALAFLLDSFDSTLPLMGGDEACIGDLAQGLFFLSSDSLLTETLELLCNRTGRRFATVERLIVERSPQEALEWIRTKGPNALSNHQLLRLFEAIPQRTPLDGPTTQFFQGLANTTKNAAVQLQCLAILCGSGDEHAATRMLDENAITPAHTALLLSFDGDSFTRLVGRLVKRVVDRQVSAELLRGLVHTAPDEGQVAPITTALLTSLQSNPADIAAIGSATECLLYGALKMSTVPPSVAELANRVIATHNAAANRCLIYVTFPTNRAWSPSAEGAKIQRAIAAALAATVTDTENRSLMVSRLMHEPHDPQYAVDLLCKMLDTRSDDALLANTELDPDLLPLYPHASTIVARVKAARPFS